MADLAAQLSDRDRRLLDFERQWWKFPGAKERAIREQFGMSATRYYQVLAALLRHGPAEAYAPVLVHQLRRIRDARARARSARHLVSLYG